MNVHTVATAGEYRTPPIDLPWNAPFVMTPRLATVLAAMIDPRATIQRARIRTSAAVQSRYEPPDSLFVTASLCSAIVFHPFVGRVGLSPERPRAQVAAAGGLDVLVNHGWAVRVLQVEGRRILASPVPPVNW